MSSDDKNNPNQNAPRDPATSPARGAAGLPRLVLETRTRLGPTVTPEQVARELQAKGVRTTVEDVRAVWDEGN